MTPLQQAVATRTADTDWKPATTKLEYRVEMINAPNPNRPTWSDGINYFYVIDSRTMKSWEWPVEHGAFQDRFIFKDLDFATKICDEINEFGHWRRQNDNRIPAQGLGDPIAARVVVYTEQITRGVVHEGQARKTDAVDEISDEKIRFLLKAPDVGSGRARLRSLIKDMVK